MGTPLINMPMGRSGFGKPTSTKISLSRRGFFVADSPPMTPGSQV